ncbi:MAG TPA: type I glyceraldehyde-3-phosphate dehydrogenase [Synergistaceae bacterium]|jgi:glyceraldehyde 3-phosphate dehydrogenase|nr:type I glyceraldehyde-3-phosphate dehydrogenase [Synergistaceae bacterium]HPX03486.1 type I glyceraldehyde-3-phosphate dehydrogenase [Synergistaceae bacterium]HQA54382.1 type I glyceraldehyde-3-phosphate dehydrogenase [Synergistaceae bacterium]
MAKYKVAINGFGRIGRLSLRSFFMNGKDNLFEIVAVNDLTPPASLAYLLKYDSVFRRFPGEVSVDGDCLVVNGKRIKAVAEPDPAKLPWKELGVDLVIESTGRFTDANAAKAHIAAGARKVIISAPAKNQDATIVMGVNEGIYDPAKHNVISNASCTTNCLAPVCKVLHEKFGIVEGLMNTIHAYTNDQVTLDFPHKSTPSRGRAAALSIIPTTTGAAKAISEVMPELKGKLNGFALRVPTPDVSVVDLTVILEKAVTADDVNAAMKEYAEGPLKGILGYEPDDLVSMDFVGDPRSSIFAPRHTMVMGDKMVKILSWYDNEWAYSNRVIDLAEYILSKGL